MKEPIKLLLKLQCEVYKKALNKIASWSEGSVVTASFDEPAAAKIARDALEETLLPNFSSSAESAGQNIESKSN